MPVRLIRLLLAGAGVFLAVVPAAHAQRSVWTGVAAGATLASGADLGYHGLLAVTVAPPKLPVRLRFDGLHAQWAAAGQAARISALTANLVLPLARWDGARPAAPYLIAGGGAYAAQSAGLRPGWNVGAGVDVRLGGRVLFLESRYHAWSRTTPGGRDWPRFTPVSLGIRF
jgi:hypothetical protein